MFTKQSQAIIYGLQVSVAERMLDFDYLSDRTASVAGFVDPSSKTKSQVKVFFGDKEILIPVFPSLSDIPNAIIADTLLNFASFRSAAQVTLEALENGRFSTIVVIAEGIPERDVREIIAKNKEYKVNIIGPATAGGICAGTFRLWNAGGSLDNIVVSKLYQSGSVGFVSKSGGMSNEMYRVLSKNTNGIHTGIALWWDRFTGMTFADVCLMYEKISEIKMLVLLGEVWWESEVEVAELMKAGKITKPVVAYVSGVFAEYLQTEVQFGHAGAKANAKLEQASEKNRLLKEAWAIVPNSYGDFGEKIKETFETLWIPFSTENEIPEEIQTKLQKIKNRTSTHFVCSISDDRWEEILYNGKKVGAYLQQGSIANVIGNLWLKRDLPPYALEFINAIIILLADHGPAVSGAVNTIVAARAGKDIVSSLSSGLLTIGPRFGGAIEGAAKYFCTNVYNRVSPEDFINEMKKKGENIPGIGHKIKSKFNPDTRCEYLQAFADANKPNRHLKFAKAVEELTLEKKPNLILNVDGVIAAMFLDIFDDVWLSHEEMETYIQSGFFNALFALSRSIGFLWHAIDQKRMGEKLHRTPWDDILYTE